MRESSVDLPIADKPPVGQHLQLKGEIAFLPRAAAAREARDLPGGGSEVGVAPAALAAARDGKGRAVGHIPDDESGVAVADDGPGRDGDVQVRAAFTEEFPLLAVRAVFSDEFAAVFEFDERILARVCGEDHVPAAPAVAAVRPALGDVFFAAEGDAAVAAVARLDVNVGFIDKHRYPHSFP